MNYNYTNDISKSSLVFLICFSFWGSLLLFKMGSPIEPGNLISQGYSNFQKKHGWQSYTFLGSGSSIIHIHTVLEGFADACETRHADFAWDCGTSHLKYLEPVFHRSIGKSIVLHNINSWSGTHTIFQMIQPCIWSSGEAQVDTTCCACSGTDYACTWDCIDIVEKNIFYVN